MKLSKIVDAYTAVNQMRCAEYFNGKQTARVERELPYDSAAALVALTANLKPQYDHFIAEENKLIAKYAKKDENSSPIINGSDIQFTDASDKKAFDTERATLSDTEASVEYKPVSMPKPAAARCSWLEALDGLVDFI